MLLTGYLENLVPLPDPSILSSYTVSLNLKKKKKIYNTGSSWGQFITLFLVSATFPLSYVSADFVLSNLDSIKFPPSPFQKSVDGANDLDLRLSYSPPALMGNQSL